MLKHIELKNNILLAKISLCPTSFQCTLNCPLGYQIDSNGCLKCECQSCPSMDQCHKNCPNGFLKDLFGCDVCECNDRCPPFYCSILCPSGVGFAQSENGCPLCQCATSRSKLIEYTSPCEVYLIEKTKKKSIYLFSILFLLFRRMFIVRLASDA